MDELESLTLQDENAEEFNIVLNKNDYDKVMNGDYILANKYLSEAKEKKDQLVAFKLWTAENSKSKENNNRAIKEPHNIQCLEDSTNTDTNSASNQRWSIDETKQLIDMYKTNIDKFNNPKYWRPSPSFAPEEAAYISGETSSLNNQNVEGNTDEDSLININEARECFASTVLQPYLTDCKTYDAIGMDEEEVILNVETFEGLLVTEDYEQLLTEFKAETQAIETEANISNEGLKYIGGYVVYTFKDKYKLYLDNQELENMPAYDWIQCLSKGRLLHPNQNLLQLCNDVRHQFKILRGNSLSKDRYIFKKLLDIVTTDLPKEVVLKVIQTLT